MKDYIVSFAGLHVAIQYDSNEVYRFLSFLFEDVHVEEIEGEVETWVTVFPSREQDEYTLTDTGNPPYTGVLGVRFAALLFDAVIFNLLNKSSDGIAFHAGAVAYKDKVILLPGLSGYGKSSMTACLIYQGFSYLTDELYFLPSDQEKTAIPFTRPVCIKSGSVAAIRELFGDKQLQGTLEDEEGIVIPHRQLSNDFHRVAERPSLVLVPKYHPDAVLGIEKLSAAQATTQLMACDVNGRNLENHGFREVAQIARTTPVYRINYNSFQGVDEAIAGLLSELHWTE